ncbi:uncharacterized protein DUF2508 [Orenia metallireducens]|jgi:hypothetical protein|uniref:DUF2508 domain-containing protein n=1 Tax=Orenia metallireducens TaxID=1413210 RepID=A0A285GYN3_9FIRM|nr:DUF2508 family protein [Orenia metallireducens]PRX26436.1 uncharacterized protein DUF2508 [Orenia metallireducens]SNY28607.1 Protein of unknown function [Orenia metallireducens]
MSFELISKIFDFSNLSTGVNENLEEQIIEAREEWDDARNYFNSVSDPDLIDHAIYLLEAAESKYRYLLKQKRSINKN